VSAQRPVALVILDGWGLSGKSPSVTTVANTPVVRNLLETCPNTTLQASAEAVGLMPGQMGDSNVGHLNMGAGRIVYQDVVMLNRQIKSGQFFTNPALVQAVENVKKHSSALHLMGLLSDGGVHSLEEHLYALLELAKRNGLDKVFVHAFLDGRDVPPTSAGTYLSRLEDKMGELGTGKIASISGRYYPMDRDKRWERVEKAWDLFLKGEGPSASSWREALEASYAKGETDEFVVPTSVLPDGEGVIRPKDSVIFFNYRADRARELSHAFTDDDFQGFPRGPKPDVYFCGLMKYEDDLSGHYAYSPLILDNTLGEVVSKAGLKQLRAAETEKYAHVTFFLNGKKDDPFPGEDRLLIPSPRNCATYDEVPEMSACTVTDEVVSRIQSGKYDLIVLNYANPDMVGHTGVFEAAVKALEAVDRCLGVFLKAMEEAGGVTLVVADHGNVEDVAPGEGGAHTYHSHNPVPCILVGDRLGRTLRPGLLADVAPTVLELLGLEKPPEMDRDSLLETPGGGFTNG
jgi:2,3-bisphosphoglycerate-independent phosphoglycerate mutase